MPGFCVGSRRIGEDQPCFIVAEVGVNHNGDLLIAEASVRAAAAAGADAVKFQTFRAERLVAPGTPRAAYQIESVGVGDQRSMLEALELSAEAHVRLQALCRELGVTFLSTPFDDESLDLLVGLSVEAIKIGSGDLDNHPLLLRAKAAGVPLIVSTGMSTLLEVAQTVELLGGPGAANLALLQCVSAYPAPASAQNLAVIPHYAALFSVPVGFSDHTLGLGAAVAAVTLGAKIIEKHFTIDRALPGPDQKASLEPAQFAQLVGAVRDAEAAIGRPVKRILEEERELRTVARRSVHLARALTRGEAIVAADLEMKRPGGGVGGAECLGLIGRLSARDLPVGHRIHLSDLI